MYKEGEFELSFDTKQYSGNFAGVNLVKSRQDIWKSFLNILEDFTGGNQDCYGVRIEFMKRKRNLGISLIFGALIVGSIIFLYDLLGLEYTLRTVAYLLMVVTFYFLFGVFSFRYLRFNVLDVIKIVLINGLACLLLYLFYTVTQLDTLLTLYFGVTLVTVLLKFIFFKSFFKKYRLLLLGDGPLKNEIGRFLSKNRSINLMEFANLHELEKLKDQVETFSPDVILNFNPDLLNNNKYIDLILQIRQSGTFYYSANDFYEYVLEKLPIHNLDKKWFLEQDGFEIFHNSFNRVLKRLTDIALASFIFVLTFPLMIIVAIIIKLESKGPAIFKQKRVGKDNKEFTIFKFRSMVNDAEKNGAQWATKKDARITRFGHFIRKTRLDELPQMANIILGQMSFVGPRPERKVFIDELVKEIPFYSLRHTVKPGLTGWAQVRYRYASSLEDTFTKLQYDLYYIKHQNILLDLNIVYKTIKIVLFFRGR